MKIICNYDPDTVGMAVIYDRYMEFNEDNLPLAEGNGKIIERNVHPKIQHFTGYHFLYCDNCRKGFHRKISEIKEINYCSNVCSAKKNGLLKYKKNKI